VTEADSRTGVGELTVLLPSWCLHSEASNLSSRTIRAYTDDGVRLSAFLARQGMPTAFARIRREQVGGVHRGRGGARRAPSSAATRYHSLPQLFKWLDDEGEISGSPITKMCLPIIPEKPVPVLSDDQVRGLLAACSGKDLRDRRDTAIIRLFLDTGMHLEGMGGPRRSADNSKWSDVELRSRVARITAKGRRELILPISGQDRARRCPVTSALVPHTRTRPVRGCGLARRVGSRRTACIR
jgi:site-specific recombinase XerD